MRFGLSSALVPCLVCARYSVMQVSSRIVFGRAFRVTPAWMWVMQRASGLLLGPLVAVHMWMPGMSQNRALDAVLLLIVVGHGYSGIRRLVQREHRLAIV